MVEEMHSTSKERKNTTLPLYLWPIPTHIHSSSHHDKSVLAKFHSTPLPSWKSIYAVMPYCHSHDNWRSRNSFQRFLEPVYYWKIVEWPETDPQLLWEDGSSMPTKRAWVTYDSYSFPYNNISLNNVAMSQISTVMTLSPSSLLC